MARGLFSTPTEIGLAAVRNIGIEEAKGEYIAWLDSDDVSLPHRLVKQVRVLAGDRRVGICGSWVKTIGAEPGHVWKYPRQDALIRAQLVFSDPLATSSVMLRKAVLQHERFDMRYPPAEDYELWQRLSSRCRVVNVPEVLTHYRVHSSQTTATPESRLRQKDAVLAFCGAAVRKSKATVLVALGASGWGRSTRSR